MRHKVLFLFVLSPVLSSCLGASHMQQVRWDLERQQEGGHYQKIVGVHAGPALIGLARWIISLTDDDDAWDASKIMRHFHRAYVRVYEFRGQSQNENLRMPTALRNLQDHGWQTALSVRDEGSNVWMLYKEKYGNVRDLYVVVADDEDLVMIRAKGNFNDLVEEAINTQSTGFRSKKKGL